MRHKLHREWIGRWLRLAPSRAQVEEYAMKVRFGVGLGSGTSPGELAGIVDRLEATGVDSLWLSELIRAGGAGTGRRRYLRR